MVKNGINAPIIVAIVGLFVIVGLLLAKGVIADNTLDSLTPRSSSYSKDSCPDIGVYISGDIKVEDLTSWYALNLAPSVTQINVDEVKANNVDIFSFLNIGTENYDWKVTAIKGTNTIVATDKGEGVLSVRDDAIYDSYSLTFRVPDNNCDGRIDDFDVTLEAELSGDDIGISRKVTKLLQFRDGGVKQ